ncbi:helix-turn-helix transcriptional regulator [Anabaena sp. CCY 9402-a]|uniref:helix-turn-helix transcriptional regulator n=1 Tax=Anabaena sp. CCY 9402-a TaxID=3103867 RepID=UPI0039C67606
MYQQFFPSIFFSPGEILQDELEASGLTLEDLSNISEDLPELVNGIIQGIQPITYRIAMMLHKAFGTSPEFWMNLEADYRLYLAHKK